MSVSSSSSSRAPAWWKPAAAIGLLATLAAVFALTRESAAPPAPEPPAVVVTPKPAATPVAPKLVAPPSDSPVVVEPAVAAPVAAEPKRARGKGEVWIEDSSGWGTAFLGARRLCETPCRVTLPAGNHSLRLKLAYGTVKKQRVRVVRIGKVRAVF